jgi:3-dehydroquinate dehydratase I
MSASRPPPLVVGTARPARLAALAALPAALRPADLVEARLDLALPSTSGGEREIDADPASFLPLCQQLERGGWPVLVTVRLVADGGRCREDAERLPIFERALATEACSWVDIEVESALAAEVVRRAHDRQVRVIVSHHDFSGTPDGAEMDATVERARRAGADVVKIATRVDDLGDHDRLIDLLRRHRDQEIAVIGMGPFGTSLRTYLPVVGSRLTYGFLDETAAPGQLPAAELRARLLTDCPAYAELHRNRTL